MKAQLLDSQGKKAGEVELPPQFEEPVRPDIIRRAFHAESSLRFQPKGAFPLAGMQTSAEYFGRRHRPRMSINVGRSRLPREKLAGMRLGRVRMVPHSVKGRRAHPPKPWKNLVEKINLKEKKKAIRSAIAATADKNLVLKRGHMLGELQLPLIVDSGFESIKKTADAAKALEQLGLAKDLHRSQKGRAHRSGVRKGGFREPKSVLIVCSAGESIAKAAASIPGVDIAVVDELNAELLAPGGVAGRLTVWTKSAIAELAGKKLFE